MPDRERLSANDEIRYAYEAQIGTSLVRLR
jgi:hypothetical protein